MLSSPNQNEEKKREMDGLIQRINLVLRAVASNPAWTQDEKSQLSKVFESPLSDLLRENGYFYVNADIYEIAFRLFLAVEVVLSFDESRVQTAHSSPCVAVFDAMREADISLPKKGVSSQQVLKEC